MQLRQNKSSSYSPSVSQEMKSLWACSQFSWGVKFASHSVPLDQHGGAVCIITAPFVASIAELIVCFVVAKCLGRLSAQKAQ